MLVQVTDFADNEVRVSLTDSAGVDEALLCNFIERYEPEILLEALGQDLVTVFGTGLTNTEQRWEYLRDGVIWTDVNGKKHKCVGIKEPLIRFVYFYYLRDIQMQNGQVGTNVPESANATRSMGADSATRQWNRAVEMLKGCLYMLENAYGALGTRLYPEYSRCDTNWCYFGYTNVFNL